jgi:hypothetical protein
MVKHTWSTLLQAALLPSLLGSPVDDPRPSLAERYKGQSD